MKLPKAVELIHKQFADTRLSYRVLRCVLFLAEGSLEKLNNYIEIAKTDYRDVIFFAEYTEHDKKHPKQIRDFNRPFGQHELKKQ